MEWTGARYADKPTVEVETWVDAPPEKVWPEVSDVTLMPSMSPELERTEWLDGVTGPALGARFEGYSRHASFGEWHTTSYVVECVEPAVFGWAVGSVDDPAASWRFTLEPVNGGTRLRQWMQMGPGRSGLSVALEQLPDKEQKIVFVRLREFEKNMAATLAEIKQRAEKAREQH